MLTSMLPDLGYFGLFLASFLAATVLPMSSEAAVAILAGLKFDPLKILAVATFGNCLGASVNYLAGLWGAKFFFS